MRNERRTGGFNVANNASPSTYLTFFSVFYFLGMVGRLRM